MDDERLKDNDALAEHFEEFLTRNGLKLPPLIRCFLTKLCVRTVTIRATGLMLIVTAIIPVSSLLFARFISIETHFFLFFFAVGIWLWTVWPLVVSLCIAKTLKYRISAVILFVPTIVYCILYIISFCMMSKNPYGYGAIGFVFISILSLPMMLPAWVIALVLNLHYTKKSTSNPGTAIRTVSSFFENENKVFFESENEV